MELDRFLSHFTGVHPTGPEQWLAHCPAHDDRRPSLPIGIGAGGRRLVHCRSGCPLDAVLAAAGLILDDLFPTPRVRALAGQEAAPGPRTGTDPAPDPTTRPRGRYGAWRAVWEEADLIRTERRLADRARRAADRLADPEGELAWALRGLAAELDTSADAAEARQDQQIRAQHDRTRRPRHGH